MHIRLHGSLLVKSDLSSRLLMIYRFRKPNRGQVIFQSPTKIDVHLRSRKTSESPKNVEYDWALVEIDTVLSHVAQDTSCRP